jgi:hypothetical protein
MERISHYVPLLSCLAGWKNKSMAAQAKAAASLPDLPEISRQELRRRLRDSSLTIVDVLPSESYAAGHIPGALSLPLELVASRAYELRPTATPRSLSIAET